jgi:oligoribonuclease
VRRRWRSSASTRRSRSPVPLCGNSIGTDRRFLANYLPDIEEHLHYRSIDVSSIKELVRRWYPKVRQARPQKVGNHRALDDIRDSVEELRYYRERVFVPADVAAAPEVP